VTLCERGETCLRERALKELKLLVAELYAERERAAARHISNEGELSRRGWPTAKLATRVAKIESAMKDLVMRCRRKSKDNLVTALTLQANDGKVSETGPPSAFKQMNTLASVGKVRGARPWDLEAAGLSGLLDVLEEASICSGNEQLRVSCEAEVLNLLRRQLQAALLTHDPVVLEECMMEAHEALRLIELSGIGDVPKLLQEAKDARHHATLAGVPVDDKTPEFLDAVKKGDTELVRWLFDKEYVNPSSVDPRSSFPAIITAARSGDLEMCQLLISRKADLNARCELDGFTALHWAAHSRSARVMQVLLAGGANPRMRDKKGQDPLMKLVRRDLNAPAAGCAWTWDMQSFRRLPGPELPGSGVMDLDDAKIAAESIAHCVGISVRSSWPGQEPCGYCYYSLRGPAGMAPAPRAKRKPKADPVDKALAGAVADGEAVDEEEEEEEEEQDEGDESLWTTYLRVATNPAHDVIAMLAAGADACSQDLSGLSTMHHHLLSAPSRGSHQVVAALLRAQADVNAVDRTARSTTPVLVVIGAKRADLLKLMLADAWPPADVDVRTSDGLSAMALAEDRGAKEVIGLLREAGATAWSNSHACIGFEEHSNVFCDTRLPIGAEA